MAEHASRRRRRRVPALSGNRLSRTDRRLRAIGHDRSDSRTDLFGPQPGDHPTRSRARRHAALKRGRTAPSDGGKHFYQGISARILMIRALRSLNRMLTFLTILIVLGLA